MRDINNFPALEKQLKKYGTSTIKVGLLGKVDQGEPAKEDIIMIGLVNEFGAVISFDDEKRAKAHRWLMAHMKDAGIEVNPGRTPGFIVIPERAAIRKAFDDESSITEVFQTGQGKLDNTEDLGEVVAAMGVMMVAKVQESYLSNIGPSNHPFTTVDKGGKNNTLVATGRLYRSVGYRVE
jgi:hypothetical protein